MWLRYFGEWQLEFSRRLRLLGGGGGGQIVSGGVEIFWGVKFFREWIKLFLYIGLKFIRKC